MDISAGSNTWVERMARLGLTAKGVVYLLLGILAFMAAFEMGSRRNDEADSNGVLLFIREWPGGTWFLGMLILGLLSFSAWRVAEAISMRKKKLKEWRKPLRYFFSAFTYLTLAFAAVQILLFKYTDDDGRHWSGSFINSGAGKIMIALVALFIAGNGFYQVWYGLSSKYKDHSRAWRLIKTQQVFY
jgi:MFS family permease